jgi:hypothetical protein
MTTARAAYLGEIEALATREPLPEPPTAEDLGSAETVRQLRADVSAMRLALLTVTNELREEKARHAEHCAELERLRTLADQRLAWIERRPERRLGAGRRSRWSDRRKS